MKRPKPSRDERARKTGRLGVARAERYALLPDDVLMSPAVSTLSLAAFKVLVVLAAQYCGRNNGKLTLPFSVARGYGICSKGTLISALRELADRGLVLETHKGGLPPYGCSRYALTWRELDPDEAAGKITGSPASHDYARWTPPETRREFRRKTERPVRPADQSGPSSGPHDTPTGPSSGPQTDDYWSVQRTLSRSGGGGRVSGVDSEARDPTSSRTRSRKQSKAGQARGQPEARPGQVPVNGSRERISKLITTLPHLSDGEIGRILSVDPTHVRTVRHAMERIT